MSQINPYYEFRVIKFMPRACPIPIPEEEKQGKDESELFTDGVKVEMVDAVGKKHWLVLHRETFPVCGIQPDERPVKKGSTGFLGITCADDHCIDLSVFEKLERGTESGRLSEQPDKAAAEIQRKET